MAYILAHLIFATVALHTIAVSKDLTDLDVLLRYNHLHKRNTLDRLINPYMKSKRLNPLHEYALADHTRSSPQAVFCTGQAAPAFGRHGQSL